MEIRKLAACAGVISGAGLIALVITGATGIMDTQGMPLELQIDGALMGLLMLGLSIVELRKRRTNEIRHGNEANES